MKSYRWVTRRTLLLVQYCEKDTPTQSQSELGDRFIAKFTNNRLKEDKRGFLFVSDKRGNVWADTILTAIKSFYFQNLFPGFRPSFCVYDDSDKIRWSNFYRPVTFGEFPSEFSLLSGDFTFLSFLPDSFSIHTVGGFDLIQTSRQSRNIKSHYYWQVFSPHRRASFALLKIPMVIREKLFADVKAYHLHLPRVPFKDFFNISPSTTFIRASFKTSYYFYHIMPGVRLRPKASSPLKNSIIQSIDGNNDSVDVPEMPLVSVIVYQ